MVEPGNAISKENETKLQKKRLKLCWRRYRLESALVMSSFQFGVTNTNQAVGLGQDYRPGDVMGGHCRTIEQVIYLFMYLLKAPSTAQGHIGA